jgi:uncharacterized protein YggT (Ycf19 family)
LFLGVEDFHQLIMHDWLIFKQIYPPEIFDLLNLLKGAFHVFLKRYQMIWHLRFCLLWFANINPYIQPFYIIIVATEPFLHFIEATVPKLFGWDLSFFIAGSIIELLVEFLPSFDF